MNEIEELCRQVVKFIPDNAPNSSTEFNRPSFAAKTTLLLAADEIARLTAENKAYADKVLTAIKILQNSDGFKAQTAINQAIGVLLGNKDNKWKREVD